jgi:hypothetical protein
MYIMHSHATSSSGRGLLRRRVILVSLRPFVAPSQASSGVSTPLSVLVSLAAIRVLARVSEVADLWRAECTFLGLMGSRPSILGLDDRGVERFDKRLRVVAVRCSVAHNIQTMSENCTW